MTRKISLQENNNWWEDAYNYDWKFQALWNSISRIREKKVNRHIEQFYVFFDPILNPLPMQRQIEKPDKNRIFIKRETKFTMEW